jgi:hypothetical protein
MDKPTKKPAKKSKSPKRDKTVHAPSTLIEGVREHGWKPLYQNLLIKLKDFKKDSAYKESAKHWRLSEIQDNSSEDDFASIAPEALYQHFMDGNLKKDTGSYGGSIAFEKYLKSKCDDAGSWECMRWFEEMLDESTSHEKFMRLLDTTNEMIEKRLVPVFNETKKLAMRFMDLTVECKNEELSAKKAEKEKKKKDKDKE